MHRTQQLCGPVLIATLSAVAGAEFEATYSTDFSDNPGTHYGQSFRTTTTMTCNWFRMAMAVLDRGTLGQNPLLAKRSLALRV